MKKWMTILASLLLLSGCGAKEDTFSLSAAEQEAYEDLLKTAPKNESFVDTPDGRGTVTEVNLLRQCVKVRMEQSPDTIGCYKNCEAAQGAAEGRGPV